MPGRWQMVFNTCPFFFNFLCLVLNVNAGAQSILYNVHWRELEAVGIGHVCFIVFLVMEHLLLLIGHLIFLFI